MKTCITTRLRADVPWLLWRAAVSSAALSRRMHRTSPARTARSLCRRPTAWVCVLVLGLAPEVAAGSLAGRLHQFIDQNGFPPSHDFVEIVTPIVQRLALRGIDFPVTAPTPSFS